MTTKSNVLGVAAIGALVAIANPSYADGPGWVFNRTVVNVVDTANGGFNVRLSPDVTACVSQGGYGQYHASVYPDHPGLKNLKATVLTAFATGKTVSVYLSDGYCKVSEIVLGTFP